MRLANYAFAAAIAFVMASGSAVAEEQMETAKNVSQPTVMSDAELDQIVGGGVVFDKLVVLLSDKIKNPDALIKALSNIGNHAP